MKLGFATDTHLDHVKDIKEQQKHFRVGRNLAKQWEFDALVVTGDITVSGKLEQHFKPFIEGVGKPVYFVLGNHDFWYTHEPSLWKAAQEYDGFLDKGLIVELTPQVALVGLTGWYDMRAGDFLTSNVIMPEMQAMPRFQGTGPDIKMVRDPFMGKSRRSTGDWPWERRVELYKRCCEFADTQTRDFLPVLEKAAGAYSKVVIGTHFPPFEDACWSPKGKLTKDDPDNVDWVPYSVNTRLGHHILALAEDFPRVDFLVLSGHTHHPGDAQIAPNVRAVTGKASYGMPNRAMVFDL